LKAAVQVRSLVQPAAAVSENWWTAKGCSFNEEDIRKTTDEGAVVVVVCEVFLYS